MHISQERFIEKGYDIFQYGPLALNNHGAFNVEAFKSSWDHLSDDKYINKLICNRERRIAKIHVHEGCAMTNLHNCLFYQDSYVNPVLGGITRKYPEIKSSVLQNPILRELLDFNIKYFSDIANQKEWVVTIHQMRVNCDDNTITNTTPEGIHCDGHKYISQHLISRKGISGGISEVYNQKKVMQTSVELSDFLDSIFLNDRKLLHRVTPFYKTNSCDSSGYHDMLIINYD